MTDTAAASTATRSSALALSATDWLLLTLPPLLAVLLIFGAMAAPTPTSLLAALLAFSGPALLLLRLRPRLRSLLQDQHALHTPGTRPVLAADAQHLATVLRDLNTLDQSFGGSLRGAITCTGDAAMEMVRCIGELNEDTSRLASYLEGIEQQSNIMQADVEASTRAIRNIGEFLRGLPAQIEAERERAHRMLESVLALASVVELIKEVSKQTKMLALNAAIEAARAGEAGRGFAVVADQVTRLSSKTAEAADTIDLRIRELRATTDSEFATEGGAVQQLQETTHLVQTIEKLENSNEDLMQFFRTQLRVVTDRNITIARDVMRMLGGIQFDDIVRQKLERIVSTMQQRIDLAEQLAQALQGNDSSTIGSIDSALQQLQEQYSQVEGRHSTVARSSSANTLDADDGSITLF